MKSKELLISAGNMQMFLKCLSFVATVVILRINRQELAIILNTASHWHLYYLSKIALIKYCNRTKCTMYLSIVNIYKVNWFCMEVCFVHGQLLISMLASCCVMYHPLNQPSQFIMQSWLWAVLRRHTNGYELCPSSSRFIFILIWVGVSSKAC